MSTPLPPLVAPASDLSREELERYSRHLTLPQLGEEGQRRLKNARVLVIGAGGLGAPALQYLAAAGVGTIGVVDDDVVSVSNLQRQVVHGMADIGRPKVDSAADAVARLNPLVTVHRHPERLSTDNALEIFSGYDLIMDGADNFGTRFLVSDAAELTGIPVVWGSILRFDGQVSVFWSGHGPVYRDLFPEAPAPGQVPSCAEGGVLGMLPATIGSVMVTEALKLITGIGRPLLGRVLIHDALAQTWRELTVLPDPHRPPVTDLSRVALACGLPSDDDAAPAPHETVTAPELAELLTARSLGETSFTLVDVREDWERNLVAIPGSVHVPLQDVLDRGVTALPDEAEGTVILHCKAGARSAQALAALRRDYALREDTVKHLDGGVLAWIDRVDPALPRY
ncbi:molybdopterin-synthase adenylyltransferase MoeB [Kocuria marina]|uniref:molybdopterin-synthase adenylyltransferase MoeB n=1 Tax=Kocuria marina TaxID=223184 RepID=UPI0019CFABC9|nr:molybdopterin-synthase adenylyltransferase MoeB [Kocuria indica]MBN6810817.1 molybdopterin-synthase adenylyltransferase MoeB [Kocuria indica]MBN6842555.1 molybdopterin-synthase adenylyltransferase MoeB [Kocuria indica]